MFTVGDSPAALLLPGAPGGGSMTLPRGAPFGLGADLRLVDLSTGAIVDARMAHADDGGAGLDPPPPAAPALVIGDPTLS